MVLCEAKYCLFLVILEQIWCSTMIDPAGRNKLMGLGLPWIRDQGKPLEEEEKKDKDGVTLQLSVFFKRL